MLDFSGFLFFLQDYLGGDLKENVKDCQNGEFYWRTRWKEASELDTPSENTCHILSLIFRYCTNDEAATLPQLSLDLSVVISSSEPLDGACKSDNNSRPSKMTSNNGIHRRKHGHFLRIPFQQTDLTRHFEQLSIDFSSVTELTLARLMAQALRSMSQSGEESDSKPRKVRATLSDPELSFWDVDIPLCYAFLDDQVAPLRLSTGSRRDQVSTVPVDVLDWMARERACDNKKDNESSAHAADLEEEDEEQEEDQNPLVILWRESLERAQAKKEAAALAAATAAAPPSPTAPPAAGAATAASPASVSNSVASSATTTKAPSPVKRVLPPKARPKKRKMVARRKGAGFHG